MLVSIEEAPLDFLGDGDGDLGGVDEGSFTDNGEEGQETNKPR